MKISEKPLLPKNYPTLAELVHYVEKRLPAKTSITDKKTGVVTTFTRTHINSVFRMNPTAILEQRDWLLSVKTGRRNCGDQCSMESLGSSFCLKLHPLIPTA